MHKKIAVLSGDGIGPEVMQAARRVLDAVLKDKHKFEYQEGLIGGQAYDVYQTHCPEETLQLCSSADAILFGSVGGPVEKQHEEKWRGCEANSILKLRQHLKLHANLRPIKFYPQLTDCSVLKVRRSEEIDLIIIRELIGGLYFGRHEKSARKDGTRFAVDECSYSEEEITCIAHTAFRTARLRKRKLCSVDKANVLATSKLWREIMNEVALSYPEVELVHMLIDNCVMQIMINPWQFDVIVTENMFGDILSDLAAVLPGSLGLIPSASFNNQHLGLYEPAGGSAPDIAGKGLANPIAQILSGAMMLRYSFGLEEETKQIEEAVCAILAQGIRTKDLNAHHYVDTNTFVEAIVDHIKGATQIML